MMKTTKKKREKKLHDAQIVNKHEIFVLYHHSHAKRILKINNSCQKKPASLSPSFLYLELGPVHPHVDSVVEGPPFEILFVIGIVDCMVQFLINLRQPGNEREGSHGVIKPSI